LIPLLRLILKKMNTMTKAKKRVKTMSEAYFKTSPTCFWC
jgi:hypothetical protein